MNLSIIVPIFNEQNNLKPLYARLKKTLPETSSDYEIILIDDESSDNSTDILENLAISDPSVKLIFLKRNSGQTAAIAAGIKHAQGDIIVTLDADLQNDPTDIKKLLAKIDEGYDVVSGWRKNRKDKLITRKIPSWIANRLIARITGVRIHDFGCAIKAYRANIFKHIDLYGEMHRFMPAYAAWAGAKITEIEVKHHPRVHGKSKYGLSRTFKVVLDLITAKFLGDYSTKPIYIFGGLGLISLFTGFLSAIASLIIKYGWGISIVRTPLLILSVLLILLGFQFILMGLLAELVIRIYHESRDKPIYIIEKTVNIESSKTAINEKTVIVN